MLTDERSQGSRQRPAAGRPARRRPRPGRAGEAAGRRRRGGGAGAKSGAAAHRRLRRIRETLAGPEGRPPAVRPCRWIEAGDWLQAKGRKSSQNCASSRSRTSRRRRAQAPVAREARRARLHTLDAPRRHALRIEVRSCATRRSSSSAGRRGQGRPPRRALLAALRPLQEWLGELNDIAAQQAMAANFAPELAAQLHRPRGRGASAAEEGGEGGRALAEAKCLARLSPEALAQCAPGAGSMARPRLASRRNRPGKKCAGGACGAVPTSRQGLHGAVGGDGETGARWFHAIMPREDRFFDRSQGPREDTGVTGRRAPPGAGRRRRRARLVRRIMQHEHEATTSPRPCCGGQAELHHPLRPRRHRGWPTLETIPSTDAEDGQGHPAVRGARVRAAHARAGRHPRPSAGSGRDAVALLPTCAAT